MRIPLFPVLMIGLVALVASGCGGGDPAPVVPPQADAGVDADIPDVVGGGPDASDGPEPPPSATVPNPPQTLDDPGPVVAFSDAGTGEDIVDAGPPPLDTDGDLISDLDEGDGAIDTDSDGTPDNLDLDSDGDGVADRDEAGDLDPRTPPEDFDGDGTPNFRDLDSDNDTLLDSLEGLLDPDADGQPAFIDLDADNDDIVDAVEGAIDTDLDGDGDFVDVDSDNDGLLDSVEGADDFDNDGRGNWRDDDSDADGLLDGVDGIEDPDGDGQPAFIDIDADGDGITDTVEGVDDFDADGRGAWIDIDSDGDTISDADEGLTDVDSDGAPSYLDLDADGDTISDAVEAGDSDVATPPADPDGDNVPSYIDLDADGDTILDETEGAADQDGDGLLSFIDTDADGDGLLDAEEAGDVLLSTAPVDTDGDGIGDYIDPDSDGDAIGDRDEGTIDSDGDTVPDFRDLDADNDGRLDASEAGDADPATPPIDTDGDGQEDFRDVDSDGDGFGDAAETGCPASTDHLAADTDADGLLDPIEVAVSTNPCDANSAVDGLFFVLAPSGPTTSATISFDQTDIDRADLALNVDTTGSMGGEIATLRTSLTSLIIPGMQSAVAEAGFAVTSFEDYPVAPFGAADVEDRPFRLFSRVTTDAVAAQDAVNRLSIRNGEDLPESGLEALYQIATGVGTSWGPSSADSVPPFDSAVGLLPGIADGTIGGVGFRQGALPIIVHLTDATSHFAPTYTGVSSAIAAVPTSSVRAALTDIGARVISVASEPLPRPVAANQTDQWFSESCRRQTARFFGRVDSPRETDVDWYALSGVAAGSVVTAEITAARVGSTLDSVLAVYSGGTRIALNDDLQIGVTSDSRVSVTLTGTGPFYVAVSSYNDLDFNASDALTSGYYFLDVAVDGVGYTPQDPTCPGADLGIAPTDATSLAALSTVPAGPSGCEAACSAEIEDEPLALPYGIAQSTGASIPPCAWDAFGVRPASCGATQCCTGPNGLGQAPNAEGQCPLSFEVGSDGAGLGDAIVTGLEALVSFSTFEFTTEVRADPTALANGVDTRCFIHGIVPTVASSPNTCAPSPVALSDRWTSVIPGTEVTFRIDARNEVDGGTSPCVPSASQPVAFQAFIDVVADGVTVVDTRTVTIVVPSSL